MQNFYASSEEIFNREEWSFETPRNTPKQENNHDCGVFTIMMADFICDEVDLKHLEQSVIKLFRDKIVVDILSRRGILLYFPLF